MLKRITAQFVSLVFCLSLVTSCANTHPFTGSTNPDQSGQETKVQETKVQETKVQETKKGSGIPKWVWWVGGVVLLGLIAGSQTSEECILAFDSSGHLIPGGCDR
jgi:hypothetical protein